LVAAGARVLVADLDRGRAVGLAARLGAEVVAADDALRTPCDLASPCAIGGVVTAEVAGRLPARLLCGAANNIFAPDGAAGVLQARGILWVPDLIASAGAVVDGIGRTVMGLADPTPLIDALGATAREVLALSAAGGPTVEEVAVGLAERRLAAGREAPAATLSPR
jgi:leucine dehydrogenase